jgi:hypothetical protein
MTHDPALEAHEHAEHAEHAAHEHDPFINRVSITIAVLAVLAATIGSLETIEEGGAITSSSEAVLSQDKATDAWDEYQSDSLKKHIYGLAADAGGPKAAKYADTAKDQVAKQAKDKTVAQENEAERDTLMAASRAHEHHHHWLTAGATLLEIGIAICTVAIITRRKAFWLGSIALGLVGLSVAGVGFLL